MAASLADIRTDLQESLDPRQWARRHPWAMAAVAAGVGLAAFRIMRPRRQSTAPPVAPAAAKPSMLREIWKFAEPALAAWLASAVAPHHRNGDT